MPSDNTNGAGDNGCPTDSQRNASHSSISIEKLSLEETKAASATANGQQHTSRELRSSRGTNSIRDWFAIPPPLKRLFDKFPLVSYSENTIPTLVSGRGEKDTLYIFTTHEQSLREKASFNPSCLKWQTYLKMAGIPFRTVPSNNHASPSGSLPFLSVAASQSDHSEDSDQLHENVEVVYGSSLRRWTQARRAQKEVSVNEDVRYEAYASLLDNAIRKAWLYQLYLNSSNASVVKRLYTEQCSSNLFVQMTIASQLRAAATSEIIKASAQSSQWIRIDESQLMRQADEAFAALSNLLGDDKWFFNSETDGSEHHHPSLFDASVFAYTHLIIDPTESKESPVINWVENPMLALLKKYSNLVRHHDRIARSYY